MQNRTGLRILVTGFGPFPHVRVNPTQQIVAALARSRRFARLGITIVPHVFATRWSILDGEMARVIHAARADAVMHLGVAARRRRISVETIARTGTRVLLPDEGGVATRRSAVSRPAMMRIAAPAQRLCAAIGRETRAVHLSNNAGRYLCNGLYAESLALRAAGRHKRPTVFVHVPLLRRAAGTVPLAAKGGGRIALRRMVRALESAIVTLAVAAR